MRTIMSFILFLLVYNGNAQIRVTEPIQNLGDIFEGGGKVHSQFKLINPYREDTIRIVDIATSCGCTAILTQDTVILPLSSITLQFTYDPEGRVGLFVKSIALTTKMGKNEINKLYLKIEGNVVAENYSVKKIQTELIDYHIAPIYFYPVTPYDTAYLDFNFIASFVNDLSYEIDFYQFTTLGIEIDVRNSKELEQLEHLIRFSKQKIIREFNTRGYPITSVFFEEPVFRIDATIPSWSAARIRLYAFNFDASEEDESQIKITSDEVVNEYKFLLDETRFGYPTVEEVLDKVNYDLIEGKLFLSKTMIIKGFIEMPRKINELEKLKFAEELEKKLFKQIKKNTGIKKKNLSIQIDSLGIHPKDKFRFLLWDKADVQMLDKFKYEVKEDVITLPQLPTYKQALRAGELTDTGNVDFKHFWSNLLLAANKHDSIPVRLVLSYTSKSADNKEIVLKHGTEIANSLKKSFFNSVGKTLVFELVPVLIGPKFVMKKSINSPINETTFILIPLINNVKAKKQIAPNSYMVNFDYFFRGIDTEAIGFKKFAAFIAQEVKEEGYVELRIESGISKIPVEDKKSNKLVAYERLIESEKRLKEALALLLVDPNRIIFVDENVVEQGPVYDGTIPILNYRKYHYLRIIPENYLKATYEK